MSEKQVVCIMGPTASGKTDLAIKLVQQFPEFEIISVDSVMLYKELSIGAAKPTEAELEIAPHHLINIRSVIEPYSAADFAKDANELIKEIFARGHRPLLVGGTMLYFKALQEGLAKLPEADSDLREALLKEAEEKGWQALHDELAVVDPESAERIHPNDPQRLQRALEVYRATGKALSAHFSESKNQVPDYEFLNIGLMPNDRAWLHERIALRFKQMLAEGLIDEVKQLQDIPGVHPDLPALRSVGYRQVWQCLNGELAEADLEEKGIVATRQLAKRQMTWMRGWSELNLVACDSDDVFNQMVSTIAKR